jgi:hypothetical protein
MNEQICKTLCIPRTDVNISEHIVRNIFNKLNIGSIGRIDMVKKQNEKGGQYVRIFIHINKWYNTENAFIAKERLLNGKDIKIIYDDPWFWKISVYKAPPLSNSTHSSDCPPPPVYNKTNYSNNKSNNKSNDKKEKEDDDDNWRKPRNKP